MNTKRKPGRPREILGGKRINIYLSAEQIEWLKTQGNASKAIQKLIDQARG